MHDESLDSGPENVIAAVFLNYREKRESAASQCSPITQSQLPCPGH